jgi:heterodisulfide reductase subunit C
MNEASSAPVSKKMHEEEISDVSLARFHVFDSENAGSHEQRARLAMGVGGCAGCGGCGCACGIGLYYHYTPPVLGDPVDPPPFRPIRPAHKSKSNRTR